MMVGAYEKAANMQMDYLPYMAFGVLMSSVGIMLYCLLIKFVLRPDMSKIATISLKRFEAETCHPWICGRKYCSLLCLVTWVWCFCPAFCPRLFRALP